MNNGSASSDGPGGEPEVPQADLRDARHHTRVGPALAVRLHFPGHAPLDGVIRDISFGGMFVEATTSGIVRGACHVEIPLGGREIRIECGAKVVRIVSSGVALRVDSISDLTSYEHLLNLIRYNSHDVKKVESEINNCGK